MKSVYVWTWDHAATYNVRTGMDLGSETSVGVTHWYGPGLQRVNKRLLGRHGTNIGEETLEALHIIKDYIIQTGGPQNVNITGEMLDSCKMSYRKYDDYLTEQRRKKVKGERSKTRMIIKIIKRKRLAI